MSRQRSSVSRVAGERRRLRRVLAGYKPEPRFTRSELERQFLDVCERHGLPLPQTNLWIGGQEVDAFWDAARLAIELDSVAFHGTRRAFHEDRRRDRALAGLGIQVLRVTSRDLADDARLACRARGNPEADAPRP